MANTNITLFTQDGSVFSDTATLTVFSGDTFTVTSSGGAAVLVFSPDLLNAVSPAPSGPITLTDGQSASFTFTSSDPGGYFISYGPAGLDIDLPFPPELSNTLSLQGLPGAIVPPPPPPPPPPAVKNTGPILNPQGDD